MIICPKCNKELEDGTQVCDACGEILSAPEAAPEAAKPSIACDKFKIDRKISLLGVFIFSVLLGLPSCFGYSIWSHITVGGMAFLDLFDFASNSVMMPIVAFLTCIFIGYFIKPKTLIDEVELTGKFKQKKLFTFIIKYAGPICIVLILISSVLDALGTVKI